MGLANEQNAAGEVESEADEREADAPAGIQIIREKKRNGAMIRKAFAMTLHPGQQEEYEKRHNPIWPDLREVLERHGASNYSIFLDRETSRLFAYVEVEDEAHWNAIARTEPCRRWWAHMKDIMQSNPDNSPVAVELREVFHLD